MPAHRWTVLLTVSLGLLLISVDMTVLYTALPTLTADLHADASEKLWIINAYPLVMAGLLMGAGTLGDRVGHRRMYLTGLLVFGVASAAAAYATSPAILIAARAFLAVGAAAMMPATLSLIRTTFDDERERNIAIAIWGSVSVCGAALGPIVGGLLLEHFWWGSVFLINLPIVVVALVLTVLVAPGGGGAGADKPWDPLASVQIMVGLVGLVYAIKEATNPAPSLFAVGVATLAAVLGFWLFVRRQRGRAYPLIDFALFRDPRILIGVVAAAAAMFTTAGVQLILSQRLQLVLGDSPLQAGLILAAFALGSLPVGVLAGARLHRVGARALITGGLLTSTLGVAGLLLVGTVGRLAVVLCLVVIGAGVGVAMTAASAAIVGNAPAHRAGMASSVEEVSYELGSLTGVAILGSALTSVYARAVVLPAGTPAEAADGMDQARAAAAGMPAEQAGPLIDAAVSAFDGGYRVTLAIACAALAAATVFSLSYRRRRVGVAAPTSAATGR
ncbi:DHA2 family multidrug resistance protein-like MFS transporter [Actinoalloteichus hoggarensis]|uniref:Methyl viologen resistance protein SmvA n=1 Tax=Actinoalloteichus hoggarensis TaxID=1470176 RepID=A0A221W3W1_9PSEU|nr:MFS transporter [Actinoalloteichus hoggarensis]ASO20498.1 Methyl viologen resistance protein SmvA [Actinoalloteichus hoggarensis]MBB5923538.1 DHA2 family multidrug resistance protein-like MFS transporter [Actinoalloteichus hoggarensis]